MFGWREGEVGQEMAALLKRKLADGVEVRVIVDRFGSRPYDTTGTGSIPMISTWTGQDEVGRADHRKLYMIDGRVAWTGGAGIEDHFENGGFHDVMVRVTGDVVRQAQAASTSFHGAGGPLPSEVTPTSPAAPREPDCS